MRCVRKVVELDILAAEVLRNLAAFQDDLFAIVVEAELHAHVALLAVAQDIAEIVAAGATCTLSVQFSPNAAEVLLTIGMAAIARCDEGLPKSFRPPL
jgi:hypothetical protein